MKTTNEIIDSMIGTFKKSGSELAEDQEAALIGCLHFWIDKVRKDQDKITRHACADNVIQIKTKEVMGAFGINPGEEKACERFRNKAHSVIMNTKAIE